MEPKREKGKYDQEREKRTPVVAIKKKGLVNHFESIHHSSLDQWKEQEEQHPAIWESTITRGKNREEGSNRSDRGDVADVLSAGPSERGGSIYMFRRIHLTHQ